MTARLRPYPVYKSSSVPWLGRIPEDWAIKPLKRCAAINQATLTETTDPDFAFQYVDIGAVGEGRMVAKPQRLSFAAAPSRARRVVRPGDTMISTVRTYLKAVCHVASCDEPTVASTGFAVLTPSDMMVPRFLFYSVLSEHFIRRVSANSVGASYPAIEPSRLGCLPIAVPSDLAEQVQISSFLDVSLAAIGRLIRAKRRQIELLNEQKQGIIAQMLTGKSESAVSRKSSGADWLGDVPSHWDIVPLKHLSRWIQNGTTPPTSERRYYDNGTIPWFGPSSIGDEFSAGTPVRLLAEEAFRDGKARLIHGPALLVVVIGATAGKSALLPGIGSSNQQLTAYELRRDRVVPEFVAYQVRMTEKWLRSSASTATIPILDTYTVSGLPIAVPPLVEQMAIVDEVNRALKPLSATIDLMHQQVALLREYRTRLIADVVTGKLDVRGVELPDLGEAGLADDVCDINAGPDHDDDEPSDTEEVEADAED